MAIATVNPFMVDVSSGVESAPGVKDRHLMEVFIQKAKAGLVRIK
jgi:phosphoribosylanthranilate isomerase